MIKKDCEDCVCLVECIGVWYCDDMNLPIDKFYECRVEKDIKKIRKQLFNLKGKKDVY